jgi:signal transduction histidine kinase
LGDVLSNLAIQPGIDISCHIDENIPLLLVDPVQISRALENIVRNSVQAMPEGGRIEIDAHIDEAYLSISFKDSGIGIPSENLQSLFEPLFTTKAKGIGLGLAISKAFVDTHNGTILVDSLVGHGTTMTVKLPLPTTNGNTIGGTTK